MNNRQLEAYLTNMCKSTPDTCCNGQQVKNVIDLSRPIQYADWPGCEVRVLTEKYENALGHKGALVACKNPKLASGEEALFIIDLRSGVGVNARLTDVRVQFKNGPEVFEDSAYINYYKNSNKSGGSGALNVVEAFDTRHEADDSNLFFSRDCCVKLSVKQTDGVWTASATVEAQ